MFKAKTFIFLGVVLVIGLALVKMLISGKPVPFKQMPGLYQCENFGIPDNNFSKMRITPEMTLVGVAADREFTVGRLAPKGEGAELEYAMETVHHPAFGLDPFTPPQIMVYKEALVIQARRSEQEFTETCARIK